MKRRRFVFLCVTPGGSVGDVYPSLESLMADFRALHFQANRDGEIFGTEGGPDARVWPVWRRELRPELP